MKKIVLNQILVDLQSNEQYYQTGSIITNNDGSKSSEKKPLLLGTKLVKYLENCRTSTNEEALSLRDLLKRIIDSFEVTTPVIIETTDAEYAVIESVFSKEALFIKVAFIDMVNQNNPVEEVVEGA